MKRLKSFRILRASVLKSIFEKALILFHFCRYRYGLKFRSRAQLERWQKSQIEKLIRTLKSTSSFYRNRIQNPWRLTPPINKKIMMDNFDALNTKGLSKEKALEVAIQSEQTRDFSPMIGGVTVGLSSGTSGSRGLFCADFFERAAYAGAILAKALPERGLLKKHRVAFFMRANSNLYKTVGGRRLKFEFFDLLHPLDAHVERLKTYLPTLLIAPPSLLFQLAQKIQEGGLSLPGIQRIFSIAEVLDPLDQKFIESQFKQKVHQVYQCTEGFLAISCKEGSLHLNEDLVFIEKEWLDKESLRFSPIITDLNRRTQPIFRYHLNDILTEDPEPCPCGSVMTRLKMIEGRCDDMVYFPKGSRWQAVFPDFIRNAVLYSSDHLQEYLITQNEEGGLKIALKGKDLPNLEAQVKVQLERLAERLECELPSVIFSHDFPVLKDAKLRRVKSLFKPAPEPKVDRLP